MSHEDDRVLYVAEVLCSHKPGPDLPYPADYPYGSIARCNCGALFTRKGDEISSWWQAMSSRQIRKARKAGHTQ